MPDSDRITIRPYQAGDARLLARIAHRIHPGQTVSPRDPDLFGRYFSDLAAGRLPQDQGSETFVAAIAGEPLGVIAVHPDVDAFTRHPRAYVDILIVAPEAEGRGIGRGLLQHVETWARQHGFREVVLDVFAGNDAATAFYERCGYRADHIRMARALD
jgi:GNAT superfamily N-acetyltransferase